MYYTYLKRSRQSDFYLVLDSSDYILEVITADMYNLLCQKGVKFCQGRYDYNSGRLYLQEGKCDVYLDLASLTSSFGSQFDDLATYYSTIHIDCREFLHKEQWLDTLPKDEWVAFTGGPDGYKIVGKHSVMVKSANKKQINALSKRDSVDLSVVNDVFKISEKYSKNAQIPFPVLVFFNRLLLELDEIPEEVERLVDSVNANVSYRPMCGGSRYDYAKGLADDYNDIKDMFPPQAFRAILYYKNDSSYKKGFELYIRVFCHMRTICANRELCIKQGKYPPVADYRMLLGVAGLPNWLEPAVRDRLYCLCD